MLVYGCSDAGGELNARGVERAVKYVLGIVLCLEAMACLWLSPPSLMGLSKEQRQRAWSAVILAGLLVACAVVLVVRAP